MASLNALTACGGVGGGVGVLVAQRASDGCYGRTPERTGRTASTFGPLVARFGEHFFESGTGTLRLFGGSHGRIDAPPHADPVVTVAGHGIQLTQRFLMFDDGGLGRLQRLHRGGGKGQGCRAGFQYRCFFAVGDERRRSRG